MTNKKSLKRAFILNVLSTLLCISMLIGTTFAWFTDSVTSGINQIVAGNLDVELTHQNGNTEENETVDSTTKLFTDVEKWEPGAVAYEVLTVSNVGDLALKYKLALNTANATASPKAADKTLADVIKVACVEDDIVTVDIDAQPDPIADDQAADDLRAALLAAVEDAAVEFTALADFSKEGNLEVGASDTYTIVLYWEPTDNDDLFNMNNANKGTVLSIDVGVRLLATQDTVEADSFDENYDIDAEIAQVSITADGQDEKLTTLADFRDAVNNGELSNVTATLLDNVDLAGADWTPIGTAANPFSGTFNGNGKTISNLTISADDATGAFFYTVADGTTIKNIKFTDVDVTGKYVAVVLGDAETTDDLTISGIEVLSGTVSATNYAAAIVFDAEGDNVNITNCTNYATILSDYSASGIGAWVYSGTGTFSGLVNYGDVTGANRAGGIFGNFAGTITNAENHGEVISTGSGSAGGIAGILGGVSTFDHCINTGDVTTTANNINASAAGILGQTPSAKATIQYCINTGDITAENSYAGGIATGLYGNTESSYCYNSGTVSGNNTSGNNPKYAAGGIAPKAAYGSSDKSSNCLNSGSVVANTNGATCMLTYQNITSSYYYTGEELKTSAGADADTEAALAALNDGASEAFFGINSNGIIMPISLIGD